MFFYQPCLLFKRWDRPSVHSESVVVCFLVLVKHCDHSSLQEERGFYLMLPGHKSSFGEQRLEPRPEPRQKPWRMAYQPAHSGLLSASSVLAARPSHLGGSHSVTVQGWTGPAYITHQSRQSLTDMATGQSDLGNFVVNVPSCQVTWLHGGDNKTLAQTISAEKEGTVQ